MSEQEESSSSWTSSDEGISAYFVLFSALLALVLVLSKLLHDRPTVNSLFPEAGMIILVGMIAGFFVNLFTPPIPDENNNSVAQGLLAFSPQVFFLVLLPPIIFNSGYHLRRELFFRHISPILLLAVLGTTVSAVSIALILELVTRYLHNNNDEFQPRFTELLTFGALISATDPVSTLAVFQAKRVDPHLFYLVFGESVLNDAVGLVLFQAFSNFVERDNGAGKIVMGVGEFVVGFLMDSIGSPVLGLFCGCAAAYLFKRIDMRRNKLVELSVYIMIMYVPFLMAELLKLSGIVCILFTGMSAKAYVVPNLSGETADHAQVFFRLAANLAETAIFLELGLSCFGLVPGSFHGWFILWSILACLVARALNVYPIALLFNKWLREKPQDAAEQEEVRQRHSQHRGRQAVEMTEQLRTSDHHREQQKRQHQDHQQQEQQQDVEKPTPTLSIPDSIEIAPMDTDTTTESSTPRYRRDLKIGANTAHMLWFSGLRGAVAYACVRSFPDTFGHRKDFVVATMVIVLVTVFCLGSTTEIVLNFLNIEMNIDEDKYMENWHRERKSASLILRCEDLIRRRVVRGALPSSGSTPIDHDTEDNGSPTSPERTIYGAQYEVTESDHMDYVAGYGLVGARRRKESLFDYGVRRH